MHPREPAQQRPAENAPHPATRAELVEDSHQYGHGLERIWTGVAGGSAGLDASEEYTPKGAAFRRNG
jgi:hypothetical protein